MLENNKPTKRIHRKCVLSCSSLSRKNLLLNEQWMVLKICPDNVSKILEDNRNVLIADSKKEQGVRGLTVKRDKFKC